MRINIRLFHKFDLVYRLKIRGVVNGKYFAVGFMNLVHNRGRSGDQIKIELALQAFLDNFHMEKAQEAAAEAVAERNRGFGLKDKGSIV